MVKEGPADLVLTGGAVYTVDAARSWASTVAVRNGRIAGSVEAGKRADLVVLDRNLFAQPATELGLAEVDLTLVDGAVVHARPGA